MNTLIANDSVADDIVKLLVCGAALGLMLAVARGAATAEGVSEGRPPSFLFRYGVLCVLYAWLATAFAVDADESNAEVLQALPYYLVTPIVVGSFLLFGVPYLRRIVRAVPEHALVRVQIVRLLGALLLVEAARGVLRPGFGVVAGIWDVLTGVGAIVFGGMLARSARGTPRYARARRFAVYWNVFGLFDLATSVAMGLLSGASMKFPVGLVPLFFVPLEVLLHIASLFGHAGEQTSNATAQPGV